MKSREDFKAVLEKFLKDKLLYTEFLNEFLKQRQTDLWSFLLQYPVQSWMDVSICWGDTVKGHNFWSMINSQWMAYCRDHS